MSPWRMSFWAGAQVLLLVLAGCRTGTDTEAALERHQRLAGELRDTKLYQAAVDEYRQILDLPDLDDARRANVNYLIAKIYYENMSDYEQAAAYYVRAKALDPGGSFVGEASKNLVACLEKMGHMMDAKRQLNAATDLVPEPPQAGDVEVARVGGNPVWLSDLEEQIQAMPADAQKQLTSRQARIDMAHQYVASELIYRAAMRENYDNDPKIRRQEEMLRKKLVVDKYVVDKIIPQVQIDTMDVRNFYEANRTARYKSAPYDSVKAQAFLDYSSEKAQAAFSAYISKLSEVDKVEFFDQNVR